MAILSRRRSTTRDEEEEEEVEGTWNYSRDDMKDLLKEDARKNPLKLGVAPPPQLNGKVIRFRRIPGLDLPPRHWDCDSDSYQRWLSKHNN